MSGEKRFIQIEIDGSTSEISARKLEQAMNRIERSIDPLGVKTKEYNRDLAYLKAGLESGGLSADQHAAKVAALGRQYDATKARLGELNQQTVTASNTTKAAGETSAQTGMSFGAMATRATAAVAAVLALGMTVKSAATEIATAGDETGQMTARFNVLTGAVDGSRTAFEAVYRVSQKTGVLLQDTGASFSRLAIAAGEFGGTTDQIARVTDVVLKLGRVGGASSQELASGVQQLGQALASGKLQGDELRSILEGMPLVGKAIAKEFGVGLGQLKQMGEEGKLTSDRVFKALIAAGSDADAQFKKLPVTLEAAGNRGSNAWKLLYSAIDDTIGVSKLLADGLDRTASRIENVAARIRGDINVALADTLDKIKQLDERAAREKATADAAGKPKDVPGADPNIVPPVVMPGAPVSRLRGPAAGSLQPPQSTAQQLGALIITATGQENEAASAAYQQMQAYDRADIEARVRAKGAADARIKALEDKALTDQAKATRDYGESVKRLKADLDAGLITQDRYNKGVAAARTIMAAASGGAKQTAEAMKALNEATRDADFSRQMANAAGQGAAAIAQLEAEGKAADKAVEAFGKRNAAWEKLYADKLLDKRGDDFRKEFTLETAELERQNKLIELQLQLSGQRPEIVDREIALLRIRNEIEGKGQDASKVDVERRAQAIANQAKLNREIEQSNRAAELWAEPFKNAISSVQTQATDFFEKFYSGGLRSFSDLSDAGRKIWFRLMAEMTAVAVVKPTLQITAQGLAGITSVTGGGSSSGSNVFSQIAASLGGRLNGASVSSIGGGLQSVGALSSVASIFGGSSQATQLGGALGSAGGLLQLAQRQGWFNFGGLSGFNLGQFLQTPFGSFSAPAGGFVDPGGGSGIGQLVSSGAAGYQAGGGLGSAFGAITPGGALMGAVGAAGGVLNAVRSGSTLGAVGGGLQAAGSLIGMIPTPWTMGIGMGMQLIGSILPMFSPPPDVSSSAVMAYDPATGQYTNNRVAFAHTVTAPMVPEIGNSVLQLLSQYGGSVAAGKSLPSYYLWTGKYKGTENSFDAAFTENATFGNLAAQYMAQGMSTDQANWAARRAIWTPGGNVALPFEGPSTDQAGIQKQMAVLLAKMAVYEGDVTGLTGTSQTIIRNFKRADPDALGQALQFGKSTYDVLARPDEMTAAEKALTDLRDSFKAAINQAKELGLATDVLTASQARQVKKYAADFGQSIEDQILGMKDPAALQRVQIERERESALKEWDYLNGEYLKGNISTLIERNKIQQLYDDKLKEITSQSMTSLIEYERRIRYGDLSAANPLESLAGALGAYQANAAQALAGNSAALAQYQTLAEAALQQQIAFSGNNYASEDLRRRQLAEVATFLSQSGMSGANNDEVLAELRALNQLMRDWQDRNVRGG